MIKEPNLMEKHRPPWRRRCPQGGGLIVKCSLKYCLQSPGFATPFSKGDRWRITLEVKERIGKHWFSMIKEPYFMEKPRPPWRRRCPCSYAEASA